MATHKSKYANPAYSIGTYAGGRVLQAAYGHMVAPTGVATADIFEITKLPFGAEVLKREVYVDGVLIAAPVVGWVGTPAALSLIQAPVPVPAGDGNVTNGPGAEVTVTYTVSADDAVAAGDDVYVIVYYVYQQPKP